jgi:hypothetical protein
VRPIEERQTPDNTRYAASKQGKRPRLNPQSLGSRAAAGNETLGVRSPRVENPFWCWISGLRCSTSMWVDGLDIHAGGLGAGAGEGGWASRP